MIFQEINEVVQGEMNDEFVKWEAGKKRAQDIKSFRSLNALLKRTSGKSSGKSSVKSDRSDASPARLPDRSVGGGLSLKELEEEELQTETLGEEEEKEQVSRTEQQKQDERYLLPVNLFDSVNMLVIATDTEGRIVHWNRYTTLYTTHYTLWNRYSTLYTMYHTLCTMHHALCTIHYTHTLYSYTMHHALG
jgi:hypothetical protein